MKKSNFLNKNSRILIAFSIFLIAIVTFFMTNFQNSHVAGYEILDANISVGENSTQIIQESGETLAENLTEVVENSEILIENATESQNVSEILNETVNETSEIMNETSYETSSEENQTLETNFTNETEEILQNETNITEDLNETAQNVTENITSASEVSNETEIISKNIKIELDYPKKIVRGGTVAVKATVSNLDVLTASNVVLLWNIPTGFQIIGDERYFCGTIEPNASCVSEITLKTDVSTSLGVNNIKVLVNYE